MIWNVIGIVLLLLLLPILVALIRSLRLRAAPPSPMLPLPDVETQRKDAEGLARLLRIPTLSRQKGEDLREFFRLHAELTELFPKLHENLEREVLDGCLLYRWRSGSDEEPIILMAHQDVVPASEEGWKHPPFSAELDGDLLYGRGAIDIKCMIYAEMRAVENLLAEGFKPTRDVILSYSVNEETSGDGAAMLVQRLKEKAVKALFVLDEGGAVLEEAMPGADRPFAMIGVCEKGYADVKISAAGKGGHSSSPARHNPLARLARFMNRVERKRPFRREISPELALMFSRLAPSLPFALRFLFGNLWLTAPLLRLLLPRVSSFGEALMATTCVFTMAEASDAANVIPARASVTANLRFSPQEGVKESLSRLKGWLEADKLELEILQARDASPVADTASPLYRQMEALIASCFPDCGISPYFVMGGTDSRHYHAISDMVLRFAPFRVSQEELAATHAKNERIRISAISEGVRFFDRLMREFCS